MNKNPKLPKDGLVEPEGKRANVGTDDVEGHGLPVTPPPSFGPLRTPGHGGESIPTPVDDDDDVEAHRIKL